jgi:hypothetical protein
VDTAIIIIVASFGRVEAGALFSLRGVPPLTASLSWRRHPDALAMALSLALLKATKPIEIEALIG